MIELKPKLLIHGAKADQTQTDIDLLNKNKGRISGIKSKSKKENEALTAAALKANPEAYELLNKITTPKNILKELEENANLKRVVIDEGINIKTIHIPNRESEMDNVSFMPANKKNDTPFAPNNHSIRKISANDFNEE
jgi:Cft2 family RNA processing exonuclease